ncbi:uncharacterized protein [Montipora foliosa]|uniref:uncharacterized protein n=1 Tax=Montipora foliosa TaxID=591990 RepID=UPI0035F16436
MWDSEQLSQMAVSFSQSSQNSSCDLFPQSCVSQLKGFNSLDVWSQPSNSQQLHEDEPVKFHMKYMSKPPLFSSESQKNKPPTAGSYKELIEIQKKKTAERDDRNVLDTFISLLKDYTKEVKSAMDSFKDSIDTTLATKTEEVATAASQSADLLRKLKEDLLESFGCLRKDLKENEELKELISKQNETIFEQDSKLKVLQAELKDCRARERKITEEHEKYVEREDRLMKQLQEISNKQTPSFSNLPYNAQVAACNTFSSGVPRNPSDVQHLQKPSIVGYQPQHVRLHHMHPQTQYATKTFCHSATSAEANMQGAAYEEAIPVMNYLPPTQLIQNEAVVPYLNIPQCQIPTQDSFIPKQSTVDHPTAAIAPMRSSTDGDQWLSCREDSKANESGNHSSLRAQNGAAFVASYETPSNVATTIFTSPGNPAPAPSLKATRPKQSPIAAVHPQIRVKAECEREGRKVTTPNCAEKVQREDPLEIFVFDLTSSPEDDYGDVLGPKPTSLKSSLSHYVDNPHITRSKAKIHMNSGNKSSTSSAKYIETVNLEQRKSKTGPNVNDKLPLNEKENSSVQVKELPTSERQESKRYGKRSDTKTPERLVKATQESVVPRSKVAKHVFQKSKIPFKRNMLAAKRKLSFDASELLDGLHGDTNLQQITESIRKHAERQKSGKVVS